MTTWIHHVTSYLPDVLLTIPHFAIFDGAWCVAIVSEMIERTYVHWVVSRPGSERIGAMRTRALNSVLFATFAFAFTRWINVVVRLAFGLFLCYERPATEAMFASAIAIDRFCGFVAGRPRWDRPYFFRWCLAVARRHVIDVFECSDEIITKYAALKAENERSKRAATFDTNSTLVREFVDERSPSTATASALSPNSADPEKCVNIRETIAPMRRVLGIRRIARDSTVRPSNRVQDLRCSVAQRERSPVPDLQNAVQPNNKNFRLTAFAFFSPEQRVRWPRY